MERHWKIGLFGFGTVGQGFYQIIQEQKLPIEVRRICVRNPNKERPGPPELFTYNAHDILEDPEIDLIVEAISETEPAFEIVKEALQRWLPVTSASKKMLALHLPELLALQQETNTAFRYEAAVAGAIPILHLLDEPLHEPVEEIRAILNGTTNYILTQMRLQHWSYEHALREAQRLGFAEANPASDVDGWDACYKLCLLARHAFGKILQPSDVEVQGISDLPVSLIEAAQQQGQRVRLLGRLKLVNGQLEASVKPEAVGPEDALFGIEHELNAVQVDLRYSGKQLFTGKGAGALPTGASVLADVLKLIEGKAYAYPKEAKSPKKVAA
ncbi:homoserine dehydrogenase [Cesiribacter sp. SM1]|uniref:homoserine dehydrogenase n=1 Tax=Cesiribacter sp. SM1 TaxID=2861196 RepID=UPI001CD3FEB5|nr:homoserine dehydrogenase [Cesiribacter sp. SM1]